MGVPRPPGRQNEGQWRPTRPGGDCLSIFCGFWGTLGTPLSALFCTVRPLFPACVSGGVSFRLLRDLGYPRGSKIDDFGGRPTSLKYCKYCADPTFAPFFSGSRSGSISGPLCLEYFRRFFVCMATLFEPGAHFVRPLFSYSCFLFLRVPGWSPGGWFHVLVMCGGLRF